MNVFLADPLILVLSIIAMLFVVATKFVKNGWIGAILHTVSFLLVLANITYALLLDVELTEILTYILIFALIGIVSLLSADNSKADKPSCAAPQEVFGKTQEAKEEQNNATETKNEF